MMMKMTLAAALLAGMMLHVTKASSPQTPQKSNMQHKALPRGWEKIQDTKTGWTYYYNLAENKSHFKHPMKHPAFTCPGWVEQKDPKTGKTCYTETATGHKQWVRPAVLLQPGWHRLKDTHRTGKMYYYNPAKMGRRTTERTPVTQWKRPVKEVGFEEDTNFGDKPKPQKIKELLARTEDGVKIYKGFMFRMKKGQLVKRKCGKPELKIGTRVTALRKEKGHVVVTTDAGRVHNVRAENWNVNFFTPPQHPGEIFVADHLDIGKIKTNLVLKGTTGKAAGATMGYNISLKGNRFDKHFDLLSNTPVDVIKDGMIVKRYGDNGPTGEEWWVEKSGALGYWNVSSYTEDKPYRYSEKQFRDRFTLDGHPFSEKKKRRRLLSRRQRELRSCEEYRLLRSMLNRHRRR